MAEFVRTREVAERLKVSIHTIIRMVERGELVGIRVGDQWRVRSDSVEKLINPNNEEKV